MTQKELGEALVKWDALTPPAAVDPRQQTLNMLRRDRGRFRWLTSLTVLLWLAAASGIPLFFGFWWQYIVPKFEKLAADIGASQEIPPRTLGNVIHVLTQAISFTSTLMFTATIVAILLAALCTILLVFVSRRATLRQVNASLVEISEQLKQLRQALGK